MRKKLLLLILCLSINILVAAQDAKKADTREFFLVNRVKKSASRINAANKQNAGKKSIATKNNSKADNKLANKLDSKIENSLANESTNNLEDEPIALGYTLYLRDEKGEGIRVDPEKVFKSGDNLRLAFEPSIDGYLYIFYVENESTPILLYPDVKLDNGDNRCQAHVPLEIPSRTTKDPKNQWFSFTGPPAKEKLYVVLTREPLSNIPTGEKLIKYSLEHNTDFKPSNETWEIIKAKIGEPCLISKTNDYGQKQTDVETRALTRKFSLGTSAPAPSTITVSSSKDTKIFATLVELIHK